MESNLTFLYNLINSIENNNFDFFYNKMALRDLNNNLIETININKFLIRNVVCCFSTSSYLNLRKIALDGLNVEYKRDRVIMKLRKPAITAIIFSSGKITCSGAKSTREALIGARRIARQIQKLGFSIKFEEYRVTNMMSSSSVPFPINLNKLVSLIPDKCQYNPELSSMLFFKMNSLKASVNVYSTGKLIVLCSSKDAISQVLSYIFPFLYESKIKSF